MPTKYDVALSFAGEDRGYVEEVADLLKRNRIRVFYDRYEEASLWGKDLYAHLSHVYEHEALFAVLFISQHFAQKLWTNHERQSAQARAFAERREYILPARFDDTIIPGVLRTVGYVDLKQKTPAQFAALIVEKLRLTSNGNGPRHTLVSTGETLPAGFVMLWLEPRAFGEAQPDALEIAIDLTRYDSMGEVLDDLFVHYLSPYVDPCSYGSQWVIRRAIRQPRLLVPYELVESWVGRGERKSVFEVSPAWLDSKPADVDFTSESVWELAVPGRCSVYVFACNDAELWRNVLASPKTLYKHIHHPGRHQAIKQQSLASLAGRRFRYVGVFEIEGDWLRVPSGSAWVEDS